MNGSPRYIAFAASSSRQSINKQLLTHACSLLQRGEVEILDLNDFEMPLFSVDREAELGQPQPAQDFYRRIGESDGVIISFAEHNGNYSAAYKNLFDWTSRIDAKVYQGKPVVLLSTSPGGRGGASVMEIALKALPRFGAEVRASLSLPKFHDYFDVERGRIKDDGLRAEVAEVINQVGD